MIAQSFKVLFPIELEDFVELWLMKTKVVELSMRRCRRRLS